MPPSCANGTSAPRKPGSLITSRDVGTTVGKAPLATYLYLALYSWTQHIDPNYALPGLRLHPASLVTHSSVSFLSRQCAVTDVEILGAGKIVAAILFFLANGLGPL